MKIKKKLLLVFLGLACLAGAIGFSAIHSLKEISGDITQVRESSVLELESTNEMAFEFIIIDHLFDEYIYETLENNPVEIALAKKQLEERFIRFEKALASTKAVTKSGLKLYDTDELADEKEELTKIENIEKKYFSYKKEILSTINSYNKHALDHKQHKNQWQEMENTLLEEVKILKKDSQTEIISETTEVVDKASQSTNLLFVIAGLSLLLAVMAAIFITKSILTPILKLKKAAQSIAGGNMVLINDIKTADEIGDLAVSFNMMTGDLIKSRKQLEEYSTALEQKVNERTEELEEALTDLKILFEDIDELVFSVDMVTYKLTKMSPACEKIYGYPAAAFFADNDLWKNVIHPEDRHIPQLGLQSLSQGKVVNDQYRIIHQTGTVHWLENKIRPTLDENGQLIRIDGVTSDITERKQAEIELEKSFSIIEATLESTADGILVTDFKGKIVRFNKKFVELWGIPQEILDKRDDQLALSFVSGQLLNPEEFISKVKELYAKQNELSFDTLRFKDGRIVERYTQPQIINGNCAGQVISFHDITSSKQAEEKIRESELRYRSVIEQATDAICITDSHLKFIDINPSGCEAFGYSKEEILQLSLFDLLFEEDFKTNPFRIDDLKPGKTLRNQRRGKKKNGTSFEFEVSSKMLSDGRILFLGSDITERKKAESILKENEGQLSVASQIAKLGYWEYDVALNLLKLNDQFYSMFKTTAEKMGGYTMSSERYAGLFVHPEDLPMLIQAAIEVIKSKDPNYNHQIQHRIKYANGETGHMAFRYFTVKNEIGRNIKIFGAIQDITESKNAEEKIKESELRYRSLIEQATDAICIADGSMKIIEINSSACQAFGYSKEEFLQLSLLDLLFLEEVKLSPIKMDDLKAGKTVSNERRGKRKDGSAFALELTSKMLQDGRLLLFGRDITERKKAEAELNKSEKQFMQVIETAQEGIWMVDENNNTTFINKKISDLIEYPREEIIGEKFYSFMDKEVNADVTEQHEKRKQGIGETHDSKFISKSGKAVWGSVSINSIFDETGTYTGALAMVTDITKRKQDEELLKQSNHRFELITKATNDAIWDWNSITDEVYCSDAYEALFGYEVSNNQLTAKIWDNRIHKDDVTRVMDKLNNQMDNVGTGIWQDEYRYIKKDGSVAYVYDRGYILYDDQNKPVRMVGAMQDITSRKKIEVELNKSESQYRQIVETAQEGIWMIDENNNTTFVNQKMCELIEYPPEEITGKNIDFFMNEKSTAIVAQQIEKRMKGSSESFYFKFIAKSGRVVWTSLSTNPIFDDAGVYKGSLAMVTDVTQRKHDEELIQKSQAELVINNTELEQKNKELEQFAYIASHDLQEPLRTISSFVELLQEQYKEQLDETANQYLAYTMQTSERMRLLISDLLSHSRIGVKKELKQVDTNLMLQEVLVDVGAAINESGAEINVGHLPIISGYATEIKQLFQNLISNAIKFRKKDIPLQIRIFSEMENNFWKFSFSDNGIGIEEKHHEKIFAIFQRLHNRKVYEGSGIGLSNCKKIVDLHKGRIWVESLPGIGSTFLFTLPAKQTDIPKITTNEAPTELHHAH